MLYRTAEMRYHEECNAVEEIVLNLNKPTTVEEIAQMASCKVGRTVELRIVNAVLDDMIYQKRVETDANRCAPIKNELVK